MLMTERQPGDRAFWLMLMSQGVSQLGDRLYQVALMWWTLHVTGSLGWSSAVLVAGTLPGVLLGPIAGAVADRFDKRIVMIASDVGRALLCLSLAGALWSGIQNVWAVLCVAACLAAFGAFFTPASQAAMPAILPPERLLQGNAWLGSLTHFCSLIGPALGGLAVAAWGVESAFLLNGLALLLSGLALLGLPKLASGADQNREGFWPIILGGVAVLQKDALVARLLTLFALVNLFTMPVMLWMPHFAMNVFKVGARGLGLLEAALALGMLGAGLGWARVRREHPPIPWITAGLSGTGVAIALMGYVPTYPGHLLSLVVAGLAMGTVNVRVMVLFQTRIPNAELGRFMGLLGSVCSALIPVSYGVYGWLSQLQDPVNLMRYNGLILTGIGIVAYVLLASLASKASYNAA
jgi:MFS family permease